ncbi:hypothetical protein EBR57_03915 [bacterium]|nr:hypothetical protein [bacterium]
MRLLEPYQSEAGNDKKIALLKPVFEALSVLSICDIYRVAFPGVRESHRGMLADGGFDPGDDATVAMKYWASHSVRMAGELGRYQLSDTLDSDGITGAYRRMDSATSDYFDLFNRVKASFLRAPDAVDSLLEQPVRKFQRPDGGQERWGPAIPYYELLYTHLIDDRVFIATKDPGEAALSYHRLFGDFT